jgi:hypothetical protein
MGAILYGLYAVQGGACGAKGKVLSRERQGLASCEVR